MVHYNIAKKIEVNPFENVKYVTISSGISNGVSTLEDFLHKKSVEVTTRKVNDRFIMLFDVELLDFTTLLKWFEPYRGVFYIQGKSNHGYKPNYSVHFKIEEDIMHVW